ncbi:MAG: hypothetical protein OXN97_05935 [Bryobacterales bacterium]|nr:hypothetical protein [Bryobacterales bacterium]
MAADLLYSDGPLRALATDLERIGEKSAECDRKLELQPLRTRPTRAYEPGSRSGGSEVYARLTGAWQVRPVGKKRPNRLIAFSGSASTVVELWPAGCLWREKENASCRLAMWRIELGADDSPGCYFHFQILGDRYDNPFPKRIPIPRLPSPFVTPMAAVEFALSELFQDKWQGKARGSRDHHRRWRKIQLQRWLSLLRWQQQTVNDTMRTGTSSPWISLKSAKPPNNLFKCA